MLRKGDRAPDFALPASGGTTTTLRALLADGPAVLFFYPGDFTPVCTREVCMNSPTLTWRLRRIGGGLWSIAAVRPRAWLLAPRLRRLKPAAPVARPVSTLHGDEDASPMPASAVLPNVDPLPSSER